MLFQHAPNLNKKNPVHPEHTARRRKINLTDSLCGRYSFVSNKALFGSRRRIRFLQQPLLKMAKVGTKIALKARTHAFVAIVCIDRNVPAVRADALMRRTDGEIGIRRTVDSIELHHRKPGIQPVLFGTTVRSV
jgi:hypothetical protein